MEYTKRLVTIGSMILIFLFSNTFAMDQKEVVQKILSNEETFKRSIITYTQDTFSESEKETVAISPTVESTFSSNGYFQRLDSAYDDLKREKIRHRKISTGEVYSDWSYSEIDIQGQATIEPATTFSDSIFPLKHFCPLTYYNGNKNDISYSLENGKIYLVWQDTQSNQNIKGIYKLEGDDLFPIEYVVVSRLPNGKEEIAVQLSYEYENSSLSQVTILHPPHNIKITRKIKNIEFDPIFPTDHFEITFNDGTWVFDKSLNAKYRYRKSFPMHLYFDEDYILGNSNSSVDKKENVSLALPSDKSLTDKKKHTHAKVPSDESTSKELNQVIAAIKSRTSDIPENSKTSGYGPKLFYYGTIVAIVFASIFVYKGILRKGRENRR